MTTITYKTGDLLKCEEKFIMHGCNAQGVMGSGVAKLLRDMDENVFTTYRRKYEEQGNKLFPGQCVLVEHIPTDSEGRHNGPAKIIINAVTQITYGREPGHRYADYEAIAKAFENINSVIDELSFYSMPGIALPLIGAGLAQGNWKIISTIIEETSTKFQPVVYTLDGVIPR